MIIWGSGSDTSELGELGGMECAVCGKVTFHAVLWYNRRHILLLFNWVAQREYYAVCHCCGNGRKMDEDSAQVMFPHDSVTVRHKKWWLVGLALLLVLGFMRIDSEENRLAADQEFYSAYIGDPQVGDVYLANLAQVEGISFGAPRSYAYGAMLLVKDEKDRLILAVSRRSYNSRREADQKLSAFLHSDFDWENPLSLSRQALAELYSGKVIYMIKRPSHKPVQIEELPN